MRIGLLSAVFAWLALTGATAHAQTAKDFVPARGVAVGGGRMAAMGNEAIFLNPAALGKRRAYTLQLDYGTASGTGAAATADALVVSILDSVSNPNFPTGLAYRWMSIGADGAETKVSTKDVSVAFPLGPSISFGTHLTYLSYTDEKTQKETISQFTGDLGLLGNFGGLQLGFVSYNLINVDSPDAARGLATGVALSDDATYMLSSDVRWDWLKDRTARSWTIGAEWVLGDVLPLRLGYDWDDVRRTQFVSGGLGFQTPQFGFDVSYRYDRTAETGYWGFAVRVNGT